MMFSGQKALLNHLQFQRDKFLIDNGHMQTLVDRSTDC